MTDMLRAINDGTTRRPPTMQAHRARPAGKIAQEAIEEEQRMEYIDFIIKLMFRMRMDSIKRMLDAALEETEQKV